MNEENFEQLGAGLSELTEWRTEQPEAWQRALAQVDAERNQPRHVIGRILNTRLSRMWLAAAAVIVILIGAGIIAQLQMGGQMRDASFSRGLQNFGDGHLTLGGAVAEDVSSDRGWPTPGGGGVGGGLVSASPPGRAESDAILEQPPVDLPAARSVIRKATIELLTADVRSAYLRAAQLVSAAQSEFIDDSALHENEDRESLSAHLTLRVRADRLDQVLNDLRRLGDVASEEAGGEDVTAQVVDLEARLRNEQQIEQELLDLLAKREDAPLKEILELREEIGRVRGRIEQYTAQVQNFSKLVSLATVLVIIRPDHAEQSGGAEDAGIGKYFGEMIADAWESGLRFLAGSIAVIVSTAVGGAIWIALAVAAFLAVRSARHAAKRSGQDSNLRPAA